ncbi:MAG: hypothetical protein ACYSTT_24880 [Planctomycetota bacterium]|jgi:hypothetical protein
MARKTVPILTVVLIILVSLLIFQQVRINRLQKTIVKYEQKDLRDKIRELVFSLAVPSEALYYDEAVIRKVAELRFDSYVQHKSTHIVAYSSIQELDRGILENPRYDWQTYHPPLPVEGANWTFIQNASFENFWLNHSIKSLRSFAFELEGHYRLGSYFKDHPDEFERFVKPWVTRSLGGYHNWTKLAACRVLLAWGDRTENIKTALRQVIATESPSNTRKAKELAAKYNLELELPIASEPNQSS